MVNKDSDKVTRVTTIFEPIRCPYMSKVINFKGEHSQQENPLAMPHLTPEQWVQIFLNQNNITYDYKTASLRQGDEAVEVKLTLSRMRLTAHSLGVTHIRSYLNDALSLWMQQESNLFLNRLKATLQYRPSSDDLCEQWVRAITGKTDPCDIAVLKHFIWQVKRKLFGLSVEWHMMPVLWGPTGAGKSVAVHKLLGPVKEVTLLQNMTVFNDQFSKRMFARNYCIFLDEMGKSKQVDIDCMKNLITSPRVEWRGIQSEAINSAKQNCTFIAATNNPLSERIYDPTSSRRFWQINCSEKMDWDAINSIDYLDLWRSVEEYQDSPICQFLDEIKRVQKAHASQQDPVLNWVIFACETGLIPESGQLTSEIYGSFRCWLRYNYPSLRLTLQAFARRLRVAVETDQAGLTFRHTAFGTTWFPNKL